MDHSSVSVRLSSGNNLMLKLHLWIEIKFVIKRQSYDITHISQSKHCSVLLDVRPLYTSYVPTFLSCLKFGLGRPIFGKRLKRLPCGILITGSQILSLERWTRPGRAWFFGARPRNFKWTGPGRDVFSKTFVWTGPGWAND